MELVVAVFWTVFGMLWTIWKTVLFDGYYCFLINCDVDNFCNPESYSCG